jgi:hypothetical protein
MNVANQELSEELHELSGWGKDSQDVWSKQSTGWELQNRLTCSTDILSYPATSPIPAYDLGYLIRKLPAFVGGDVLTLYPYGDEYDGVSEWICELSGYETGCTSRADTPENAAAKLAIELFKQNILTKA